MVKEKIVLVGCGQHANVVIYNLKMQNKYDVACILDSDENNHGKIISGYEVVGNYDNLEVIKQKYNTNKFFIAFGNMKYRKTVFDLFVKNDWEPVNIIHPNAVVSDNAKLGKGILIECGCLITPNPIIGNNVVVNTGSQVNHDNVIEDHVYIASGVILSGGVHIGSNTLLDDGVIVTLGKRICDNTLIGAGAIVTKHIDEPGVYYGQPAKFIRKKNNRGY